MRPRVKTANRGSSGVSPFLTIEFNPPFTTTSTTRRKIAVTITTPSMVLIICGFDPRAQNLGWRILGEESLSGHMGPDPPSFRNRTVALYYKRAIQADRALRRFQTQSSRGPG